MPDKMEIVSDTGVLGQTDKEWYRSVFGQLSWFATTTRWDLAHSVSRLGQFVASPTEGALKAMKRVVAYVASTAGFKIGGPKLCGSTVEYHCDSDCGGEIKPGIHSKSQTGIMLMMNGVPVMWRSQKQAYTATSPATAEITALYDAVVQARALQWRSEELGMEMQWPFTMCVDNTQAKSFSENTCVSSKLVGVYDMREDWVQTLRDQGLVKVQYVGGQANKANLLTKCLSSGAFNTGVRIVQEG